MYIHVQCIYLYTCACVHVHVHEKYLWCNSDVVGVQEVVDHVVLVEVGESIQHLPGQFAQWLHTGGEGGGGGGEREGGRERESERERERDRERERETERERERERETEREGRREGGREGEKQRAAQNTQSNTQHIQCIHACGVHVHVYIHVHTLCTQCTFVLIAMSYSLDCFEVMRVSTLSSYHSDTTNSLSGGTKSSERDTRTQGRHVTMQANLNHSQALHHVLTVASPLDVQVGTQTPVFQLQHGLEAAHDVDWVGRQG